MRANEKSVILFLIFVWFLKAINFFLLQSVPNISHLLILLSLLLLVSNIQNIFVTSDTSAPATILKICFEDFLNYMTTRVFGLFKTRIDDNVNNNDNYNQCWFEYSFIGIWMLKKQLPSNYEFRRAIVLPSESKLDIISLNYQVYYW